MFVEKENQYKIEHEVAHKGGFGLFWIAVAIVWAAAILGPDKEQIDCFLEIAQACSTISETYK